MRFRCRIGTPIDFTPAIVPTPVARAAGAPASARPPVRRTGPGSPRSPRRRLHWRLGPVAGAVLVVAAGCAGVQPVSRTVKIEPVFEVRHGNQSSAAYVTLGTYYEGAQSWDKAADSYRKALAADGGNAEAQAALGVALARAGRLDEAEPALRKAVAMAPGKGHVRNNLGYVLLLQGRPSEAAAAFEAVLAQDGGNAVARANLREALARAEVGAAGGAPLAAAIPSPLAAAIPPSLPATVAPPAVQEPAASTPPAMPSAPATASVAGFRVGYEAATAISVRTAASPPLALRDPLPAPAAAGPAAAPIAAPASPRVEISNGNGVPGLAARVGDYLAARGLAKARLTNRLPFHQRTTVVEFRSGHEGDALRVAALLPLRAQGGPVVSTTLRGDVRVVIGHDWAAAPACDGGSACEGGSGVVALAQPRR